MASLPEVNATLLSIAGGGTTGDYDSPPGADTARWQGTEDCYVVEKVLTDVSGQTLDLARETRLVIPAGLIGVQQEGAAEAPEKMRQGDTATYSQAGVTVSRTVRSIEEHEAAGTVRLYLEDL